MYSLLHYSFLFFTLASSVLFFISATKWHKRFDESSTRKMHQRNSVHFATIAHPLDLFNTLCIHKNIVILLFIYILKIFEIFWIIRSILRFKTKTYDKNTITFTPKSYLRHLSISTLLLDGSVLLFPLTSKYYTGSGKESSSITLKNDKQESSQRMLTSDWKAFQYDFSTKICCKLQKPMLFSLFILKKRNSMELTMF